MIFAIVLVVNLLWEMGQSFLYAPHYQGLYEFIIVHVRASLGDVVIVGIGYLFGAMIFRDVQWVMQRNMWIFLYCVFVGCALAVLVEKLALAQGRWVYNSAMPLIPVAHVGLLPVMQMIILPIGMIFLARVFAHD